MRITFICLLAEHQGESCIMRSSPHQFADNHQRNCGETFVRIPLRDVSYVHGERGNRTQHIMMAKVFPSDINIQARVVHHVERPSRKRDICRALPPRESVHSELSILQGDRHTVSIGGIKSAINCIRRIRMRAIRHLFQGCMVRSDLTGKLCSI